MKWTYADDLSLDLRSTSQLMPTPEDVVDDETILRKLEVLDDIEIRDAYGRTLLINAAAYGRFKVVQYLLERGADITAKDKQGFTSLHMAALHRHTDVVAVLLANGADPNAQNMFGNNALMVCNWGVPKELLSLLIQYHADPRLPNRNGITAVYTFTDHPDAEIRKIVLNEQG